MKSNNYHICEFGTIARASDFNRTKGEDFLNNIVYLPDDSFNSIDNFILDNQSTEGDKEPPFTLFRKNKKRQIRVRNYVGVIETRAGTSIEILPKIHLGKNLDTINETKIIFLKMLRELKNSPFKTLGQAHLHVRENFPLLEVFITSYINESENLLNTGLRSDYTIEHGNLNFLKGKLIIPLNIKRNAGTKSKFYCEYSEFIADIPQNRIIKSTLVKLLKTSGRFKNITALNKMISVMDQIPDSENIVEDLRICSTNSRLFDNYKNILRWSEIFLLNKSFTNFKGNALNTAVLFPMEIIFQDYIASLFRKYTDAYQIKTQDRSLFLINRHRNNPLFSLRPDIYLEKNPGDCLIIDTKWKLLDQNSHNYDLKSSDMYQLFAYGKKYKNNHASVYLAMIYPSNPDFQSRA